MCQFMDIANNRHTILVVINPISGGGKKTDIPARVMDSIDHNIYNVEIVETEYAGHAYKLAKKAIDSNYYAVVAVGGDGTINEVASALADSDVALGIVPRGSGNGLARHIGIPMGADSAINVINENNIESYDYCMVNDRPFFCTCGVGFDAVVSEKFAESKKRGPITYLKNTVAEFFKYQSESYNITINDRTFTEKAFVIACCNASQYGNNAYIAPNASMQDGLIDITMIHPFSPPETPILGLLLFTKHIDIDTNIQCMRASKVIIEREQEGVMHIDGEPINMGKRLEIMCQPRGLKIFTPNNPHQWQPVIPPISIADNFKDFVKGIRNELNI